MERMIFVVVTAAVISTACAGTSPIAPTIAASPVPVVHDLGYAINVPEPILAQQLLTAHPDGVRIAPIAAQLAWNYTAAYGGSPNVYLGPIGQATNYLGASIVIAPAQVAGEAVFDGAEWPPAFTAGEKYAWVGRFVYTAPAPSGTVEAPIQMPTLPQAGR